jgi:hypothetical protein
MRFVKTPEMKEESLVYRNAGKTKMGMGGLIILWLYK